MIKKNWIYFLFGFSVIVYVASVAIGHRQHIEARALYLGSGWGYEILINKKPFITQRIIPSVAGNKTFTTKDQAMTVANLVIGKIEKKKGFPTVTPKELDSLGIVIGK